MQPWNHELALRARRGFVRTVIWTALLTGLFFVGYFQVQRHPVHPPTVMPLIGLDLLIPFQPSALAAYASLWIYIGAGPGLQRTMADFLAYGAWMAAMCLTALAIFHFWPTAVPALILPITDSPALAVLQQVDAASNACPSMHVAAAMFTLLRVDEVFRETDTPTPMRLLNAAWFAAIAYSTMAIKQHVVLDVIAGMIFGMSFAVFSQYWRPGSERGALARTQSQ